ncbi:MAG: site-specific integrase [Lachnospiraceae bacterium]|nr:site-specific integrase [Lachnospiraceae bacterium]
MGRLGENIHKRKDGRWEARVVFGDPICGRTRYKYLYGRSYQEAKAKKKAFLRGLDALQAAAACKETAVICDADPAFLNHVEPLDIPEEPVVSAASSAPAPLAPTVCFSDVAEKWLASKKLAIKESSYAFYSVMITNHLLPRFGGFDIKDVDYDQIASFLSDEKQHGRLRDQGPLSDKTLSELKSILYRILRFGKSRHYISEVPESIPITVKKTPIPVFSESEQVCMEKQGRQEDTAFSVGILFTAYTGIRVGEICALKWSDFDWENGTVSISKTVNRVRDTDSESGARTHVVIGPPKTDSSNRTIPIPESVLPYFKAHAGESANYVLTGSKKFMEPRVCRSRFARFLKRAGIKHHTFHTLRHTYATNCVAEGMDIKSLSEILGHSDVSITLARYVHPSLDTKKAQVNKLKTFANR